MFVYIVVCINININKSRCTYIYIYVYIYIWYVRGLVWGVLEGLKGFWCFRIVGVGKLLGHPESSLLGEMGSLMMAHTHTHIYIYI